MESAELDHASDFFFLNLGGTIAAAYPHAFAYATATEGPAFLRSVGDQITRVSEGPGDFGSRVVATARSVALQCSEAHAALFDFDAWSLSIGQCELIGRHERAFPPIEVLGERSFPVEVLSFTRFIQRFMYTGSPLDLLAKHSPKSRTQQLHANRTTRGVEIIEVTE